MDEHLIYLHNKVVTHKDITVHIGDFSLFSKYYDDIQFKYISRLNGKHIFIPGSHDWWLKGTNQGSHIWEKRIEGQCVVCCHYAMRRWPKISLWCLAFVRALSRESSTIWEII